MNCIYWDKQYPRLITKDYIQQTYSKKLKLQVIGDISVDINGAIEFTEKTTTPDNPVFVYNPTTDSITNDIEDEGVVVMAVDNLPCELPRESSQEFSHALRSFVPAIAQADYTVEFSELKLPPKIKKAVILHKGKLTPEYRYIDKYL
jgi:alpha-aminoadipic semialdehyde synthase